MDIIDALMVINDQQQENKRLKFKQIILLLLFDSLFWAIKISGVLMLGFIIWTTLASGLIQGAAKDICPYVK